MKKKIYLIIFIIIGLFSTIHSQEIFFHGKVLDSLGNPKKDAEVCAIILNPDHTLRYDLWYNNCVKTQKLGQYTLKISPGYYVSIKIPYDSITIEKFYSYKEDPFDKTAYLVEVEKINSIEKIPIQKDTLKTNSFPIKKKDEDQIELDYPKNTRFWNNNNIAQFQIKNDSAFILSDADIIKGLMNIEIETWFKYSEIGKTPDLQTTYVQGRPLNGQLTYQPPATQDPFSWGPKFNNVLGIEKYLPNDFFENPIQFGAALNCEYGTPNGDDYQLKWNANTSTGIFKPIEESYFQLFGKYSPSWDEGNFDIYVGFSRNESTLPLSGNNMSLILYSLYNQPISFNSKDNILSSQNEQISASQLYNNPHFLTQYNKDTKKNNHFFGGANYSIKTDNGWYLDGKINAQFNKNQWNYGQIPMSVQVPSPSFFNRDYQQQLYNLSLNGERYWNKIKTRFKINQQYELYNLDKNKWTDYQSIFNFPNDGIKEKYVQENLNRYSGNFEMEINYNEYLGEVNFENNFNQGLYLSSTNSESGSYYFKNYSQFKYNTYADGIESIKLWLSYESSLSEPPILSNNLSFNMLSFQLEDFSNYIESKELFINQKLDKLQNKKTFEIGINTFHFNEILEFKFNYYNFKIANAFAPVYNGLDFQWKNAVDFNQSGIEMGLNFQHQTRDYIIRFKTNFHTYSNETESINIGDFDRIPYFGFQNISKNYIVGQPVGVLIGSGNKRNEQGRLIIGDDGFPLVDENYQIIGNPNPDFIWNFHPSFEIFNFSVGAIFQWNKGGDIWNGTQQTLNYFGRSKITENERDITNFVFDGVLENGNNNSQTVDFANPANDVLSNRWVRYGLNGVAEAGIEDASFLRISEIYLSFKSKNILNNKISELYLKGFVTNPWVISKYNGVFPGNPLFGDDAGIGMDYFNIPIVTTFGLNLQITF